LPKGAKVDGALAPKQQALDTCTTKDCNADATKLSYTVSDRVEGSVLHIDRALDIPAGRIQPADYPAFVEFGRAADDALHRDFVIQLP
jgi:hypothetical protein